MEHRSRLFARVARHPLDQSPALPDEWRLARAVRANLLLIHPNEASYPLMEQLLRDAHQPIATWSPGERLVLPPVAWARTMVLQDVGFLGYEDQRRLLSWLAGAAGRTQVVSTTSVPLLSRVQNGTFLDSLYYRLNTVCVNAADPAVADAVAV